MYVPRPEPVPPPNECIKKNDYRLSHFSAYFLIISDNYSLYFGP